MDADYDDKFALKHAALEEGSEKLHEETEHVKARLKKAKDTKKLLQAEVSFLQKRIKLLKESATPEHRIGNSLVTEEPFEQSNETSKVAELLKKPVFVQDSVKKGAYQPSARHPSKKQEVVGVLKPSSLKNAPNGFPPNKSRGKRKISWQDEGLIKV